MLVYNYGCLHLSIGLLLRNADDSVNQCDGERLLRVWNFLTVYRANNHTKYALVALRLKASQLGLLTPREAQTELEPFCFHKGRAREVHIKGP